MKKLLILGLLAAGLAYGVAKWQLHSKVSKSMDRVVMMASPFAKIEYEGVRSTFGGELTVEGIQVDFNDFRDPLNIDRVGIDTGGFFALLKISDFVTLKHDSIPDYFGFIVENARVPADADYFRTAYRFMEQASGRETPEDPQLTCAGQYGLSPAMLGDLGYTEQVFSMRTGFRREAAGILVDFDMRIDDMWDATASLELAGSFTPGQAMTGGYKPRMSRFRLEYTDRSLNERIHAHCERNGLTAEQILKAQIDAFKRYGVDSGIEFDEYVIDPYVEFLQGKDTLVITAEPNEPVALSQIDLYKPSDVPALLKLEASTY
ncbi:MAG: hypothetical protein AAGE85_02400 [Pseudomonadota bacterium]